MTILKYMMAILDYPNVCVSLAFVLGALVGSFLNVCIARIPLQKSIVWPGSRCGSCFQAIRWYDNIPLISYWRLRGRCRKCGATFSSRYFWIESLTALSFAGLFWAEVVHNVLHIGILSGNRTLAVEPAYLLLIWCYHSLFLCFLIVVTFIDIEHMEVYLSITIPGTVLGILGGTLGPWPWPIPAEEVVRSTIDWQSLRLGGIGMRDIFVIPAGMQRWPIWLPPWEWFPPGSWQLGLATSLGGAVLGFFLVWLIRLIFGYALGKEAMGLGDADIMMMIGAFLGWQALIAVMVFAVFLGLLYAVVLIVRNRGHELPFGPFLAGGAVITMVSSWWLGATFQGLFFDLGTVIMYVAVTCVLAFFLTLSLRMLRLIGQAT